jgi:hypothetical protein
MSKESLDQVLQRASTDARFRASLSANFEGAVRQFDLSNEEKARLAKGLGITAAAASHAMPVAQAASLEATHVHAASLEASHMSASSLEAQSLEAQSLEAQSLEAQSLEAQSLEAQSLEAQSLEAQSGGLEIK